MRQSGSFFHPVLLRTCRALCTQGLIYTLQDTVYSSLCDVFTTGRGLLYVFPLSPTHSHTDLRIMHWLKRNETEIDLETEHM